GPLAPGNPAPELVFPGRTLPAGTPSTADWRDIWPGYFRTMGIPLRGRDFDARDAPTEPGTASPAVIIISEAFARRYWPNEDAIGKTVVITSFGRGVQSC